MNYIEWTDEQLEAAGLDKKKIEKITRRFRKLSKEMDEMGLTVYGASGSGCLIHVSRPTHNDALGAAPDQGSVIAHLGRGFDGGDW
jgi:hypothetical protein